MSALARHQLCPVYTDWAQLAGRNHLFLSGASAASVALILLERPVEIQRNDHFPDKPNGHHKQQKKPLMLDSNNPASAQVGSCKCTRASLLVEFACASVLVRVSASESARARVLTRASLLAQVCSLGCVRPIFPQEPFTMLSGIKRNG